MNINRDFLIILDVKSGEVDSPNIYYFNTDKNTSNLYVQMVLHETTVDVNPIENALDYSIKANILKPNMVAEIVEGTLVNEEKAIYEFNLPENCINFSGNAKIEFEVFCTVNGVEEIATSFATKFKVHGSILTEQNKYIKDSSDYPILKELMAEVKVINETAHELDTTIRTLQADMIDANNEMKTNEATRQANETTRVVNEATRVEAERTRTNNEAARIEAEAIREGQEATRVANENERKTAENQRKANEEARVANEVERKADEASRVSAENARATNEEQRQTNEVNREAAEEIRKANEEARIAEHEVMRTEHDQTMTAVNEVKAENAVLMENDKKLADRMTQVEISDKRQYVIMEGLMNSAGDGYLKIEDTGNDTTLYNSVEGFVDVKNITGNTMVNSIKNPDDELTLNADINTSGQSVTLTTAIDNGQVDVLVEGNTMVNVCDQQEAVAITKSYTVETGNHVALQGEYDGKARPVPTGNTLVNLVNRFGDREIVQETNNGILYGDITNLKPNTNYTIIYYIKASNNFTVISTAKLGMFRLDAWYNDGTTNTCPYAFVGDLTTEYQKIVAKFTTSSNTALNKININIRNAYTDSAFGLESNTLSIKDVIVLEGDYTNKPIPDYFTGMQSSFEDKVVTQDMVDSGKELAENLGKYRVDYKVTGKNKFNKDTVLLNTKINSDGTLIADSTIHTSDFIKVNPNTIYTKTDNALYSEYDNDKKFIRRIGNSTFTTGVNCHYVRLHVLSDVLDAYQLEEGETATVYEPYKEQVKTYYLNSPLLKGDTIEESGGNVYHVHRYKKKVLNGSDDESWANGSNGGNTDETSTVWHTQIQCSDIKNLGNIICNKLPSITSGNLWTSNNSAIAINNLGFIQITIPKNNLSSLDSIGVKAWLANNPLTVIYELASPTYELISQNDTILTDSYVSGHLDFDSVVPVERVKFQRPAFSLKYLYPSTKYVIQFESDNNGILDDTHMSGGIVKDITVTKGINKFNITTGSTISWTNLDLGGIGFSASNIVVTEATDKDFGYFSGMKSVGELEENKIEILSRNKNLIPTDRIDSSIKNSETVNGVTFTMNTDGTFYMNGTATGHAWLYSGNLIDLLEDGVYYTVFGYTALEYKDKYGNKYYPWQGVKFNKSIHTEAKIYFTLERGKTYDNVLVKPALMDSNYGFNNDTWIEHQSNKKQILLNEPLRAVGDIKDRFIKIDGKWYVERNCGEIVLDGSELWCKGGYKTSFYLADLYNQISLATVSNDNKNGICDRFCVKKNNDVSEDDYLSMAINHDSNGSLFILFPSGMASADSVKSYLSNNPATLIYPKKTTYEPVEIAPTVNTYTDVTHITSNSTIPMNMNIKNSGYELIAKPSTKYTVVGITNGRIGDSTIVNGTITTPATITDNFLRPYGTGKTSKVMLLEGEPANMPGYFKGIKSVFEDKVTDDGKYAVEVKVIGKNKFNINQNFVYGYLNEKTGKIELTDRATNLIKNSTGFTVNVNSQYGGVVSDFIRVKPNTSYKFNANKEKEFAEQSNICFCDMNKNPLGIGKRDVSLFSPFTTPYNCYYIRVGFWLYDSSRSPISYTNIQLEEGTVASEYEPYHETKQTIYLDEPLYNANNITIYNDKLGYWKNWDSVVLDGNEDWKNYWNQYENEKHKVFNMDLDNKKTSYAHCDKFIGKGLSETINETISFNNGGMKSVGVRIHKSKLPTQDVAGFKQWLSQNPVTVVYELAEPVFVPLIDNCPNWVIGSWDNCSIHFDSIIPLLSTRYRYTGNVPSVMTMSNDVAAVSDISDQQDSMIIDLATQVATMEMMLM